MTKSRMNFDEVLDKMDNVKYNDDKVRMKIDDVIRRMTLLELSGYLSFQFADLVQKKGQRLTDK